MTAIFLEGSAVDKLKCLPADFVHCAVTSPPYFGLRKYDGGEEVWDGDADCEHEWGAVGNIHTGGLQKAGQPSQRQGRDFSAANEVRDRKTGSFCSLCDAWKGQLGGEPTPDLYISHLVQIMREVRRVLRKDGIFWVNIGDSWAGSGKGQMGDGSHAAKHGEKQHTNTGCLVGGIPKMEMVNGIKPLDMVLIPSLLALALRADGWYMRSMICWSKNNPMPESVNGWRFEQHKVKLSSGEVKRGQAIVAVPRSARKNPASLGEAGFFFLAPSIQDLSLSL